MISKVVRKLGFEFRKLRESLGSYSEMIKRIFFETEED
jgi:hypothetical protein